MAQAQTEAKPIVNRTQALVWLRQMMLIRRFEERAEMLYQKGNKIGGFFHQYSGQEPVAVGSIGVLREDDYLITAYRDHGHALARGMSARSGMAELLGKVTGCSRGKGGSMHFFDVEKGFLGGHAIVGSHIPLAAGVAFAIKYRGEDRVCLCYFGDGAINQGSVHEALNMAALWKLPVIYIVENNLYAMGTSLERSTAVLDLTASRRHGLRHPRLHHQRQRHRADGQDHPRGDQPRSGRRGPHVHRGPDLPLQGPLDQRSRASTGSATSWTAPSRTTRSSSTRTS